MFGIGKERLEEGLGNIQHNLCAYMGETCDCKYGIDRVDKKFGPTTRQMFSEQTGCPELRQALALIQAMTPEQFQELCVKARLF